MRNKEFIGRPIPEKRNERLDDGWPESGEMMFKDIKFWRRKYINWCKCDDTRYEDLRCDRARIWRCKIWKTWDVKVRKCDASAKMRCGFEDARCRSEMWRCSGRCDTQRHKMLQVRSFYMLTLSHRNSFTHNLFYIQMLLFPTCQVRVVRFYVCGPSFLPLPLLLPLPLPLPCCRTLRQMSPDAKRDLQSAVGNAGPQ